VVYRIDSNDVLVHVDGAFRRFAAAAGVPDLPDDALGRSLWNFIEDDELRAVYAALVARARDGHPVHVETRCDSPSIASNVEMDITLRADGDVEIACRAGSARLITPALASGSELLRICAWCYRAESGGAWRAIEDVVAEQHLLERPTVPVVTHGICDACLADTAAGMESAATA
jgi:hypothetical protein